jgi:alcohol dehydrogenase class IV
VPLVVHGLGATRSVAKLLDERGLRRVLMVSTRSLLEGADALGDVREALGDRVVGVAPPIRSHTAIPDVAAVVACGAEVAPDVLVAVGGSSVIDGAKLAALRLVGADAVTIIEDGVPRYTQANCEVVPIPLIALPTTLSAGEYRPSAGMVDGARGTKLLCEDRRLRPSAIILDPALTVHTPAELWASSGVKAIDHAAETIWGTRSHPMGDLLAAGALRGLAGSLPRTLVDPDDLGARLECQIASWLSIHTMTNTLIHLSHALEHCMGGYWHISHGVTSCIALPVVMEYLADLEPHKVAQVSRALGAVREGGDTSDLRVARAGAQWLREFIGSLPVPTRLRDVVGDFSDAEEVARIAVHELGFFGYVPPGGESTIMALLSRMW